MNEGLPCDFFWCGGLCDTLSTQKHPRQYLPVELSSSGRERLFVLTVQSEGSFQGQALDYTSEQGLLSHIQSLITKTLKNTSLVNDFYKNDFCC